MMIDVGLVLRRRLRQIFSFLVITPLHPQWLVYRCSRGRSSWVAARAQGNVLDIGCADCSIKQQLNLAEVYFGLDFPETATKLYQTRPHVYGDASQLPFTAKSFDTVLMLDVLEHLSEPELALHEASRVLKEQGRLLITIPFSYPLHDQPHDYQRFTIHGLTYHIHKAGFELAEINEVGGGAQAAALALSVTVAQGAINAMTQRGWRVFFIPLALPLIPIFNLAGFILSWLLPAEEILPTAYYVEAKRIGATQCQ